MSVFVHTGLEDFEVEGFSFFDFFSGGATGEGDLTVPWSSTAPITETDAGSTRVSLSLDEVESSFIASHFSFLNLYEGVAVQGLVRYRTYSPWCVAVQRKGPSLYPYPCSVRSMHENQNWP